MKPATRLLVYIGILGLAFGGGAAIGAAVGPLRDGGTPASTHHGAAGAGATVDDRSDDVVSRRL